MNREAATVFKRIQSDFGNLSATGLLDDVEQFEDTIEFYEQLKKNITKKDSKIRQRFIYNSISTEGGKAGGESYSIYKTEILKRLEQLKNKK